MDRSERPLSITKTKTKDICIGSKVKNYQPDSTRLDFTMTTRLRTFVLRPLSPKATPTAILTDLQEQFHSDLPLRTSSLMNTILDVFTHDSRVSPLSELYFGAVSLCAAQRSTHNITTLLAACHIDHPTHLTKKC